MDLEVKSCGGSISEPWTGCVNWLLAVSGGLTLLRMDVTSLFSWDGDSYSQDEGEDKFLSLA